MNDIESELLRAGVLLLSRNQKIVSRLLKLADEKAINKELEEMIVDTYCDTRAYYITERAYVAHGEINEATVELAEFELFHPEIDYRTMPGAENADMVWVLHDKKRIDETIKESTEE